MEWHKTEMYCTVSESSGTRQHELCGLLSTEPSLFGIHEAGRNNVGVRSFGIPSQNYCGLEDFVSAVPL